MQRYIFLFLATLFGFFGFGLLSVVFLVIAWVEARPNGDDELNAVHKEWIRKSAKFAIFFHLLLLAIIIIKAGMVVWNEGEGWFQSLIAHWFIDHIGEALISIWLLYRVMKGATSINNNRMPSRHDLDVMPSKESS